MFGTVRENKVDLISSRKDVIGFCLKAVEKKVSLQVRFQVDDIKEIYSSTIAFIDVSLFRDRINLLFDNIEQSADLILIVPYDVPNEIKVIINRSFKNIMPFPCDINIVKRFLDNFLDSDDSVKFKKNYFVDKYKVDKNDEVFSDFVGTSPSLKKTKSDLLRFANSDEPVLIMGESGTGKTVLARKIHEISKRSTCEFQSMNIAEVSENIASSTFFGTEKGAYTDAKKQNGLFKKVDGGTLFLDEIGLAPVAVQSKLLTVLDSGHIYSVGSNRQEKVDVRMIFATNANLRKKMTTGEFRKDLYFRIANYIVYIPPLRERRCDIKDIANFYANKKSKSISKKAFEKLENYDWPGNVRQLKSCIQNATLYSENNEIKADDIKFNL